MAERMKQHPGRRLQRRPFLPAGLPEESPPDLFAIEQLRKREFFLLALLHANVADQYVTGAVQMPMLEKCRAVGVECFNNESVVFPSRYALRFNRPYGYKAILAKCKFPNDRSIITNEQAVVGLGDL